MTGLEWQALCRPLIELADEIVEALAADDDGLAEDLSAERHERYGVLLAALGVSPPDPAAVAALRRVQDADRVLHSSLTQHLAATRAALSDLSRGKRALAGYAAASGYAALADRRPRSFVDRCL